MRSNMLPACFLCNALQQIDHTRMDPCRSLMAVRQPNESQQQLPVVRHCPCQQSLVQPKSLTQLTLHPITVYGMMETFLRYADQQLDRHVTLLSRL